MPLLAIKQEAKPRTRNGGEATDCGQSQPNTRCLGSK